MNINDLKFSKPFFGRNNRKLFSLTSIRSSKSNLLIEQDAELIFGPNKNEDEDYGINYSIGLRFEDDSLTNFLNQILEKNFIESGLSKSEWSTKDIGNDDGDVIFFKLKTNPTQTKFKFKSNIDLKPLKLAEQQFDSGMPMSIKFNVKGWFNKESKTYGLCFQILELNFGDHSTETLQPKKKKTKKQDDDEVFYFSLFL